MSPEWGTSRYVAATQQTSEKHLHRFLAEFDFRFRCAAWASCEASAPIIRFACSFSSWFCAMTKYHSPAGFPDEHMRLVGIISAHWEWVELTLERTVAEAMDREYQEVGLLTENITFHALCDVLTIYSQPLETLRPDLWKEFSATLTDLKNAYSARNRYVHAKWRLEQGACAAQTFAQDRGSLELLTSRSRRLIWSLRLNRFGVRGNVLSGSHRRAACCRPHSE
jgi:hypothetical protein